jgi:putative DNA primase/helicase
MRPVLEISAHDLVDRIRSNVPEELQDRRQWCLWKIGGDRKIPLSPWGGYASCTDPKTWGTFDQAEEVFLKNANVCRGFNLAMGDGLAGMDLDDVVTGGTVSPLMTLFLNHLGSYPEFSPSGTGLHSFFLCDREHENRKTHAVELYFQAHFLSVTGDVFEGRDRLRTADVGAERILTALRPRKPLLPRVPLKEIPESDSELLEKMFASRVGGKIRRLWDGECCHKTPSESDMALMGYLAYWCGGNTDRMIALFLTSARAERAKGQRADYLQRMAGKAARNP